MRSRNRVARLTFRAIGTHNELVVTHPADLPASTAYVSDYLAALDRAVSRFQPASELSELARLARRAPATLMLSDLCADHLEAALRAAQRTDGLVDPTVGAAVLAQGYDADLAEVLARDVTRARRAAVPGWQQVQLRGNRVSVPAGTVLDLGVTSKAYAADVLARRLAALIGDPGSGFLVDLGGDIAVAGTPPEEGWRVAVRDHADRTRQLVSITEGAVTTSSSRPAWQTDQGPRHHVVDPRTGISAETCWAQVTCAAASAVDANAASTAALILGDDAPRWLESRGIPARLEAHDGHVVRVCGWPVHAPRARQRAA
ncbi:MAG: FAD:protein FMN transferase [Nocardioidaceae bacterium]